MPQSLPYTDDGVPVRGRRPKNRLSDDEKGQVRAWRKEGWGWESMAHEISQARASKVATAEAKARRSVSHSWLRRQFSNETLSPTKMQNPRSRANLQRKPKVTDYTGSRVQPFNNSGGFVNGPESVDEKPFTPKVESEQPKAT